MKSRHDTYEMGDSTALICVDDDRLLPILSDQLDTLGIKIHTGLFHDDIVLRLQTQSYDVLVIHDRFEGADVESNSILATCRELSPTERRAYFVALIGSNFRTEDGLHAFQHSVDLVCSLADLGGFGVVLRRALESRNQFYACFHDSLEQATLA